MVFLYATEKLVNDGPGDDIKAINYATFLNTIGFSVYAFEGVGAILPILDVTARPEKFKFSLFSMLTVVLILYIAFGEYCYIAYGNKTQNTITLNLPRGDPLVYILTILFCINLIFSYPLIIFPSFLVFEGWFFSNWKRSCGR